MWSKRELEFLTGVWQPTGNNRRVLRWKVREKARKAIESLNLLYKQPDVWADNGFKAEFAELLAALVEGYAEHVDSRVKPEARALRERVERLKELEKEIEIVG